MSDFTVGGYDIRAVQAKMLQILCVIDRICEENGIRYVLDGGTLLGAVRHRGFIPWDDDADIMMLRKDYDRFAEIAQEQLPAGYVFQCRENTEEYPYNFGKVFAADTLFEEPFTAKLRICHGIYVDVFPMDDVTEKNWKFRAAWVSHFTMLRYYKMGLLDRRKYMRYIPFCVISHRLIDRSINHLLRCRPGKGTMVCKLCHPGPKKPPIMRGILDHTLRTDFEGRSFPIPQAYDDFLRGRYGDYMQVPPAAQQMPAHQRGAVRL